MAIQNNKFMKIPLNGQNYQKALGPRNLKRPLFFNASSNKTQPTLFRDTFIFLLNFYFLNFIVFLIFGVFYFFQLFQCYIEM